MLLEQNFAVGNTLSIGTSPNTTSVVLYEIINNEENATAVLRVGPDVIAGTGGGGGTSGALDDGDVIGITGGSATISTGGIATAENNFVFSTTTAVALINTMEQMTLLSSLMIGHIVLM